MKLVWTRLAQEDRRAIREYIASDNPGAALAMDELFSDKAARLVNIPEMGKPDRVPETRELVVHHSYILITSSRPIRCRCCVCCIQRASGPSQ